MSEFFSKQFYGNTVWDWTVALCFIVGAIILGKICYWISGKFIKRLTAKTETRLDDILVDMLEEPVVFAIIISGIWFGIHSLQLNEMLSLWLGRIYTVLVALNAAWLLSRVLLALMDEYIRPLTERTDTDFDDQLFPILKKSINTIIWTLGVIVGLNNAGYDVGALIAGLGIGGLALAMAAKDTVSNFFGGFTIFTDKPFKMGDRVKIDNYDGFVVEVGLRSFRLQTLNGTIVTIPNSKVTDSLVENITREPSRKVTLNLGLTYDTTPEKMELAMQLLKDIAAANDNVNDDYLVSFMNFGDFSLGILFIYYIKKESNILQTQSEMNLEILRRFNASSLNFAFPTQTLYIEK